MQAGNGTYAAATPVVQTVVASKLAASVTPNAAGKAFGAADPIPLTTGTLTGFLAGDGVSATVLRTPLVKLDLGKDGRDIRLKLENLQPTNAYKIRGASNAVANLSEEARARDSLNLLNWGFTGFDAVKLYDKGQAISQLKVFKGAQNVVKAGFAEDFVVSVPRGTADKLSVQLVSQQPLIAPVAAGAVVGTLKLAVAGQPWGEYPVVAQNAVPVAGFFGRLWDDLRLFFQ